LNVDAGYYLDSFLAPLAPILARDDVTDIYINRPGELWVESLAGKTTRIAIEELQDALLGRLARQIAASTAQGISREQPLLAATLPDGSRIQIVAPPATRAGYAFAIRKHISRKLTLDDWVGADAFECLQAGKRSLNEQREYVTLSPTEAPQYLRDAVRKRRNLLISGGTSSGKTTFLNALLGEVGEAERLIVIEDTEELHFRQQNAVGLLVARSELSEANVTAEDLLIAALRMRPDRIILGELRGKEAFTFLRAVNTGHPGSMTTIHADSPTRAIDQLALLVLQSGSKIAWEDLHKYIRASIDVFVHLERQAGRRMVAQIMVKN